MSNSVNTPSSRRKHWSSRGASSKNGSHLAEDGCADSQVLLAKQLLESGGSESDVQENARQAVYWLIKASKQGHPEATRLLNECVDSGRGITEQNFLDVKECLQMPDEEKQAVKVAKDIFSKLCAHDDYITSDQLRNALKLAERLTAGMSDTTTKKLIHDLLSGNSEATGLPSNWYCVFDDNGEKISEAKLIQAAHTYSNGELPALCQPLVWRDYRLQYRPLNFWFNALIHPLSTAYVFYLFLTKLLSLNVIFPLIYSMSPHFYIILLLLTLPDVKFDDFIPIFPPLMYWSSLAIMIFTSCQILHHKHDFRHFRAWSNLFILYSEGSFVPTRAETKNGWKIIPAYRWFFISFLVHVIMHSSKSVNPLFQSECAATAFFFTFLTLCSFTFTGPTYSSSVHSFDGIGLLSFILYVVAKYPYGTDSTVSIGWRFLDAKFPTFVSYVIGHGVEFCLNFRGFFYLVIPALLLRMAFRSKWTGIYTDLIPHLAILSWWEIALLFSKDATGYLLLRGTLTLVGLIMFIPLTCLFIIVAPIYVTFEYLKMYENAVTIVISAFITILLPIVNLYCHKMRSPKAKFLSILQILVCAFAVGVLIRNKHAEETRIYSKPIDIEWNDFQKFCNYDGVTITGNTINSQLLCSRLVGTEINWKGYVKTTRIAKIYNPILFLTSAFYNDVGLLVRCIFGQNVSCTENDDVCKKLGKKCDVGNWNQFQFHIDVKMSDAAGSWNKENNEEVQLVADNKFINFAQQLFPNDYIWFTGSLIGDDNGILSPTFPRVKLSEIGCISCTNEIPPQKTQLIDYSEERLSKAIKFTLNFFFSPLIKFT